MAVTEDASLLRKLRLEALASDPEAFAADYASAESEPVELWTERIDKYIKGNSGTICVALAENRLIGMIGIAREHWPKTRHNATIWGVFVKTDWRGHHIAEALIKNCIDWARAQELLIVKLSVVTTNLSAVRLYARYRFTVYGLDQKVIYINNVFYDELLMAFPVHTIV